MNLGERLGIRLELFDMTHAECIAERDDADALGQNDRACYIDEYIRNEFNG